MNGSVSPSPSPSTAISVSVNRSSRVAANRLIRPSIAVPVGPFTPDWSSNDRITHARVGFSASASAPNAVYGAGSPGSHV